MSRIKTLFTYLILFLLLYVIVDFLAYQYLISTYKNMTYTISDTSLELQVMEAKATTVNGYVTGRVKNTYSKKINCIYLKIDLYSKRDIKLGTKYVKLEEFKVNETKEFRANFNLEGVEKCEFSYTLEDMSAKILEEEQKMNETINKWIPIIKVAKWFVVLVIL